VSSGEEEEEEEEEGDGRELDLSLRSDGIESNRYLRRCYSILLDADIVKNA